jgi:peptidyl-prolyl cis-trans isomerase A (cyclophilin A)
VEHFPAMKTIHLICALGIFAVGIWGGCSQASPGSQPVAADTNSASTSAATTTTATATAAATATTAASPGFDDPSKLTAKAPDDFKVVFDTTKGNFTIEVTRSLAPNGADRFYNLVRSGFFTGVEFFRVVPGFMAQFGIHGDPNVSAKWRDANIQDDPVKGSNTRGTITFATAGPNTRTTQLFINFQDNTSLDGQGFAPFGKVVAGMDVVDKIDGEYGDAAQFGGHGPDQGELQAEGNTYLKKDFPNLDYIKSATIVQ